METPDKRTGPQSPNTLTRRQRNAQQNRALDMEFATEIGQNLLVEVRRLQSLLTERDRTITQMNEERDAWETERAEYVTAVKNAESTVGESGRSLSWAIRS